MRRSAIQLHGAAVVERLPGRDFVRGVGAWRHSFVGAVGDAGPYRAEGWNKGLQKEG